MLSPALSLQVVRKAAVWAVVSNATTLLRDTGALDDDSLIRRVQHVSTSVRIPALVEVRDLLRPAIVAGRPWHMRIERHHVLAAINHTDLCNG